MIIVVADHHQVVWYADTKIGGCLDDADGERIRWANHPVHGIGLRHQMSQRTARADPEVWRFDHAETGAGFGNGSLYAGQAAANQSQLRNQRGRRVGALPASA